jgi:hypothetical protein
LGKSYWEGEEGQRGFQAEGRPDNVVPRWDVVEGGACLREKPVGVFFGALGSERFMNTTKALDALEGIIQLWITA